MKKEHLIKNYEEIVESFYKDVQHIVYCQASLQAKVKMLHGAHYRATYYLGLHNLILKQQFQEKPQA